VASLRQLLFTLAVSYFDSYCRVLLYFMFHCVLFAEPCYIVIHKKPGSLLSILSCPVVHCVMLVLSYVQMN